MKKQLLIVSLLFFSILGSSQARIGYSLDSLKKEFVDPRYHSIVSVQNNVLQMEILTIESRVLYLFDKESEICEVSVIYPYSQKIRQKLVNDYNEKYDAVSKTRWKYETDKHIIILIELLQEISTGNICFIWTYMLEPC